MFPTSKWPARVLPIRWLVLLCCLLSLSACTSAIAISTAYQAATSRFTSEMLGYADFTTQQKRDIRRRVAAFHQWHREQQLPRYQQLIGQITATLASPGEVSEREVEDWINTARLLSRQLSDCSPLNRSGSFMQSLNSRQVRQIETAIKDRHQQRVREYQTVSPEDRRIQRTKTAVKWAKRAGVRMNNKQLKLLEQTLAAQISLTPRRHELWQMWSNRLISLLNQRATAGSDIMIDQHIGSLWNLTEATYPDQWKTNIKLWQDFLFRFVQLMDAEQARRLTEKLKAVSNSLETLQNKTRKSIPQCFYAAR
jgi:hypothetical protein